MLPSNPELPTLHHRQISHRHGSISHVRPHNVISRRSMTVLARAPASTTDSSDPATISCGPNDRTGPCERMVAASPNTTTIPVVLGVVIPLTFAFVILVVLHRRHVRRLRREDAEDRHKSLDFGMDDAVVSEKKNKKRGKGINHRPEMHTTHLHDPARKDRGMSLDLTIANPYILPPELQGSRESLHSLSRSINHGDDKYRTTNFIPDDGSLRSPSSLRHRDDASIYTYSSRQRTETDSTRGLLPHGHVPANEHVPTIRKPMPTSKEQDNHTLLAPTAPEASRDSFVSNDSRNGNLAAMRASNDYLGQYISGGAKAKAAPDGKETNTQAAELDGDMPCGELQSPPPAAVEDVPSKRNSQIPVDGGFDFGIPPNTHELSSIREAPTPHIEITVAQPTATQIHEAPGHDVEPLSQPKQMLQHAERIPNQPSERRELSSHKITPEINVVNEYEEESDYYDEDEGGDPYDINVYKDALGYDPRRLTMGMRPLPPDDPTENPEERALRIRSFYKEYFDETTKPGGEKARLSYFDGSENYIDDYYGSNNQQNYGHGSYDYGPHNPYSHGSYRQGPYAYSSRGPSMSSARGPRGRHRATVSNGSYSYGGPGPRAYSSASQRLPGQRMKYPVKPRPPPQPLAVLPTPSMLKDDSMLPNAIDYAPPQVFKNQRAGTPDSLRGGVRPFSPSARAYNPLVSSFDDLSVLPSPHQLRKSGTYSNLDFAPPRFVAASNAGSDTGSIRSNRSGMSARQLHHIRAGAYRLSRIPKEVAGTKEELANALKPQWNAR